MRLVALSVEENGMRALQRLRHSMLRRGNTRFDCMPDAASACEPTGAVTRCRHQSAQVSCRFPLR